MLIGKWYSYTVVILGISGCVVEGEPADIGYQANPALSSNALSSNALTSNALTSNALTSNALTSNALSSNALSSNALSSNALTSNALSSNVLTLNPDSSRGLQSTPEGRALLGYVVRCALEPQDILTVVADDVVYEFTGALGLLPEWKHQPLSRQGEEILSACLSAHVNAYGVSVPISIRHNRLLGASDDEQTRYLSHEGAFFGNLFDPSGAIYACSGDAAPSFEVSYPEHDQTAGDRLLRRCTDARADAPEMTECGFIYVGSCNDVCDALDQDGHSQCWTDRSRTGERFDTAMNVWLLAYDDTESVWPELYHTVYGR